MRFNCYCQKGFDLPLKEARLIIQDFELFCSPQCFLKYVLECEKKNAVNIVYGPCVSVAYECWDDTTSQFYRSMYEVYVVRFLLKHGIEFYYEPHSFKVEKSFYTPDFWLPEKGLYIECKGKWGMGSKTKTQKAAKQIPLVLLPSYLQKQFEKEDKKCMIHPVNIYYR